MNEAEKIIKKKILDKMDCGSNSCLFAKNKRGIRTNSPCNCFPWLSLKARIIVAKWNRGE